MWCVLFCTNLVLHKVIGTFDVSMQWRTQPKNRCRANLGYKFCLKNNNNHITVYDKILNNTLQWGNLKQLVTVT